MQVAAGKSIAGKSDRRRRLVRQILMRRLGRRHMAVDIVGEVPHHVFDAVTDVVHTWRQGGTARAFVDRAI